MISKMIHYCWFGGNPLPDMARKCIDTWKKYFPDYEIKQWDESNFDFTCCDYAREAYEAKKWAFVSDYARFWILYHEGGLYFDTDVEVIRNLEPILKNGSFMACEAGNINKQIMAVAPGLGLAAEPELFVYRELLDYYENIHFTDQNGGINTETVVEKTTNILVQHGFQPEKVEIQKVAGLFIYPPEYFCPKNYHTGELNITENTYSIHHYSESWFTFADKMIHVISRKFSGYGRGGYYLGRILHFPFRVIAKIEKIGLKNAIKFAIGKLKRS